MKPLNIVLSFLILIVFSSCQDSDRDEDTTTNSSIDYAIGQSITLDIFELVNQAAYSSKGITSLNLLDTNSLFGCDSLMVDTVSSPAILTITFNNNCSSNGIIRNGKITATFSSKYDLVGCNVNITFDNYTHGNYLINSGSISSTYTGISDFIPKYTYNTDKLRIENGINRNMIWSGNQTLSIVSGQGTASSTDNTYLISGKANGSTFKGNSFSATINSDLRALGSCNWISSGELTISPENKSVRELDFGSICDNEATVSFFGIDYDIILE